MSQAFTFDFPASVLNITLQKPNFIHASDGNKLAFYSFAGPSPKKVLIFYHGGGAWAGRLYQHFAAQLRDEKSTAVYLFDIRGHGNSEGPRGDAPSARQVWQDVRSAIDFVQSKHPNLPITLGGHSSGAGLVLNYSLWHKHPAVTDYLFLAPFLGPHAKTNYEHADPQKRFVHKVRLLPLLLYNMSGHRLCAHSPAIFFNYPAEIKEKEPFLLSCYTNAMSHAVTPIDPAKSIQELKRPYAVLIGNDDEAFDAQKVVSFFWRNSKTEAIAQTLSNCSHFSILYDAARLYDAIENCCRLCP